MEERKDMSLDNPNTVDAIGIEKNTGIASVPKIGLSFLEKANEACADFGIRVRSAHHPDSQRQPGS